MKPAGWMSIPAESWGVNQVCNACLVGGEHDVGAGDGVHGLPVLHLILVHVAGDAPRQQLRPRLLRPLPQQTAASEDALRMLATFLLILRPDCCHIYGK